MLTHHLTARAAQPGSAWASADSVPSTSINAVLVSSNSRSVPHETMQADGSGGTHIRGVTTI